MDDNEVRTGRAAGQDAASISLPAVAWQQAGEEPEGEPGRKPQAERGGEPDGETGSGPVAGAVAAEPVPDAVAEPETPATPPAASSGAAPALPAAGETGSDAGDDTGTTGAGGAPEGASGDGDRRIAGGHHGLTRPRPTPCPST
ncbi:hypothetical protein ABTY14_29140, partial [Streptomyces hydrogenans]